VRRGEIFVAHLPEPVGRRPVLLGTIPKQALRRKSVGSLSSDELPALDTAIRYALGIKG
jgi:hypothetical protein